MKPRVEHVRCPYCHGGVRPDEAKTACVACMTWHHLDCWREQRGCAACGRHERFGLAAPEPAAAAVCPRCEAPVHVGTFEEITLRFCQGCWGSWIPVASLGPLLLDLDPGERPESGASAAPPGPTREPPVPCFDCGQPMPKWLWRGLVLDCCPGHGLWVDSGELVELRLLAEHHPQELYDLLRDLSAA